MKCIKLTDNGKFALLFMLGLLLFILFFYLIGFIMISFNSPLINFINDEVNVIIYLANGVAGFGVFVSSIIIMFILAPIIIEIFKFIKSLFYISNCKESK